MLYLVLYSILIITHTAMCSHVIEPDEDMRDLCSGIDYSKYCKPIGSCEAGSHVMCMYYKRGRLMGPSCVNGRMIRLDREIKDMILDMINGLRREIAKGTAIGKNKVFLPKGYSIFKVKWDKNLAIFAQLWANQCRFSRDNQCLATKRFPNPGQFMGSYRYTIPTWKGQEEANITGPIKNCLTPSKVKMAVQHSIDVVLQERYWTQRKHVLQYSKKHRNTFLQLAHGNITHVGCGMSAYKDFYWSVDSDKYDYYYLELVCNLSSQPKEGVPVYDLEPRHQKGYSQKCGCPPNFVEGPDCICLEAHELNTIEQDTQTTTTEPGAKTTTTDPDKETTTTDTDKETTTTDPYEETTTTDPDKETTTTDTDEETTTTDPDKETTNKDPDKETTTTDTDEETTTTDPDKETTTTDTDIETTTTDPDKETTATDTDKETTTTDPDKETTTTDTDEETTTTDPDKETTTTDTDEETTTTDPDKEITTTDADEEITTTDPDKETTTTDTDEETTATDRDKEITTTDTDEETTTTDPDNETTTTDTDKETTTTDTEEETTTTDPDKKTTTIDPDKDTTTTDTNKETTTTDTDEETTTTDPDKDTTTTDTDKETTTTDTDEETTTTDPDEEATTIDGKNRDKSTSSDNPDSATQTKPSSDNTTPGSDGRDDPQGFKDKYGWGSGSERPSVLILPIITMDEAPEDLRLNPWKTEASDSQGNSTKKFLSDDMNDIVNQLIEGQNISNLQYTPSLDFGNSQDTNQSAPNVENLILHNNSDIFLQSHRNNSKYSSSCNNASTNLIRKSSIFSRVAPFDLSFPNHDIKHDQKTSDNVTLKENLQTFLKKVPKKDLSRLEELFIKMIIKKQSQAADKQNKISITPLPSSLIRPVKSYYHEMDPDKIVPKDERFVGNKLKYQNRKNMLENSVNIAVLKNRKKLVPMKIKDEDKIVRTESQIDMPVIRKQSPLVNDHRNIFYSNILDKIDPQRRSNGYYNSAKTDIEWVNNANAISNIGNKANGKSKYVDENSMTDESKLKRTLYLHSEINKLKNKLKHLRQYAHQKSITDKRVRPVVAGPTHSELYHMKSDTNNYLPDMA